MKKNIILSIILALATLIDLLVPVIISAKYPNYNHLIQTISTLGTKNSPVKIYQNFNLVIVGILFITFAFGQHFMFRSNGSIYKWYTTGIILYGVGCVFAGIFPEDIQGLSESLSGKIHGIASGIGFLFLILCPLFSIWIDEFRDNKILNIMIFILGLTSFILFLVSENKTTGLLKYTGLFQRINLIILYSSLLINYHKLINHISID